jgi:hypothetical protein
MTCRGIKNTNLCFTEPQVQTYYGYMQPELAGNQFRVAR